MHPLRVLQIETLLMVTCALVAYIAQEQGVEAQRDAYLLLAGCCAALAAMHIGL